MRPGVFSISIPVHLANFVDEYAKRKGMRRSHVIAEALRRMEQSERAKELRHE